MDCGWHPVPRRPSQCLFLPPPRADLSSWPLFIIQIKPPSEDSFSDILKGSRPQPHPALIWSFPCEVQTGEHPSPSGSRAFILQALGCPGRWGIYTVRCGQRASLTCGPRGRSPRSLFHTRALEWQFQISANVLRTAPLLGAALGRLLRAGSWDSHSRHPGGWPRLAPLPLG